ncbi:MAG TPA: hypothetical protein PLN21_11760 [Gemmatales bacterium]|nr:hypothetical protein [Gemmatales bacterium]
MPLVRLQCPACASIVKISDEIVAQHPLVRCAKCQGLVTVATSRVIEQSASADDSDDYSYKPKKKKKKSPGSAVPVAMIVGIVVGLLVFVGAGIGIYFLINHFGGSPLDKQFKQGLAIMQRMADAFDTMQTPQDVPRVFDQIKTCAADLKQLDEDNRNAGIDTHGEQANKVAEKYMPEYLKLTQRITSVMTRLAMNPAMAQAIKENIARLGPDLQQAMMRGSLNREAMQPQLNFGNNVPGSTTPTLSLQSHTMQQQQLEQALISKSLQAKMLPGVLEEIRDSQTAELNLLRIDAVIQSLTNIDRTIKQLEREVGRSRTTSGQNALHDIEKTIDELAVHLARIERLSDLGSVHARIVSKLSEVGLASSTSITASKRPPGNDSGNPLESSPSGRVRRAPGKTDGGNPSEPAASRGMSGSMDSMIAKLTSNDHFTKLEGLKEAQSAKVDEGSKTAVLDALLKLCGDSDVHQKVEVLKAYKKWATTQEDKEKLGEHAEVMLKDHWTKKDALRYFGENKVVSASKEVAYLLKNNFDRNDAWDTLIAMGSEAEKAVIPHLTDLEPQVRQMAIEVLARIGTPACIPDLQKLKSDRFVGRAASQAITLINSRKK